MVARLEAQFGLLAVHAEECVFLIVLANRHIGVQDVGYTHPQGVTLR